MLEADQETTPNQQYHQILQEILPPDLYADGQRTWNGLQAWFAPELLAVLDALKHRGFTVTGISTLKAFGDETAREEVTLYPTAHHWSLPIKPNTPTQKMTDFINKQVKTWGPDVYFDVIFDPSTGK